jgi:hypothetical protein
MTCPRLIYAPPGKRLPLASIATGAWHGCPSRWSGDVK